jgi:hypothetical protein
MGVLYVVCILSKGRKRLTKSGFRPPWYRKVYRQSVASIYIDISSGSQDRPPDQLLESLLEG